VKAIEDIIVKYDGTVRNAGGKVLKTELRRGVVDR
jgi:hypothetical protein